MYAESSPQYGLGAGRDPGGAGHVPSRGGNVPPQAVTAGQALLAATSRRQDLLGRGPARPVQA